MRKEVEEQAHDRNMERIVERFGQGFYRTYIGLDPGRKWIYAGVIQQKDVTKPHHLIKYSGNTYRSLVGEFNRLRSQKKFCRKVDKNYNEESKKSSANSIKFERYTEFRLRYFNKKQKQYEKEKVARLKVRKYIAIRKITNRMAQELICDKHTLIFIGAATMAANSPIKGYARVPMPKICASFKRHADIMYVDEFRTTKLCSRCFSVAKTYVSPDRYQVCDFCKRTWNRDINGGNNILQKGLRLLNDSVEHPNFLRN